MKERTEGKYAHDERRRYPKEKLKIKKKKKKHEKKSLKVGEKKTPKASLK